MKKLALFAATALTLSPFAFANTGSNTGTITKFHLNSTSGVRGVCIQMEPALTQGNQWACLNDKNMHLYSEMTSLLLSGFLAKSSCTIFWNGFSSLNGQTSHANIHMMECDAN